MGVVVVGDGEEGNAVVADAAVPMVGVGSSPRAAARYAAAKAEVPWLADGEAAEEGDSVAVVGLVMTI